MTVLLLLKGSYIICSGENIVSKA